MIDTSTDWCAEIGTVERRRLLFPDFEQAYRRISRIHRMALAGTKPRNLMILGPSGAGKSSVLEEYRSYFPAIEEPEQRRIPVLLVEIKSFPTVRSVAEDILKAMGVPMAYRGTVNEKTDRVVSSLAKFNVELLMFDEAQHLLGANKRSFGSNEETEWLKTLLNLINIPVVLSGLPYAEALLSTNEQLKRRLEGICRLSPFSVGDETAASNFAGVVNWFDAEIHMGQAIGLHDGDMLERLFFASDGLIGYLSKLLIGAMEIRLEHGYKRVESWMLEQSFMENLWSEGIGPLNPFHKNFVHRRLNRTGELYAPTDFSALAKPSS
ncbi:TniB family NTP-binding protein [Chromobacterium haemolyticum]|uniref:TniB family NTP-binding protein n=1 Tax=Chromobacterium haemolyticum TaxID=394935 RepID=UPI0017469867|nr:TniB family NTP-binding protein [Chromobacterium haemolyticum]QOD82935.1 TniB family NTP-binding protein [Chromobacterium haemolyticum]